MDTKLAFFAGQYNMLPEGSRVLCAVSGGADSVCLLDLLFSLAPKLGFSLGVAHYNHRLRAAEADRDEDFVRVLCQCRSLPFFSGSGNVASFAKENGMGTEEAARILRYRFLQQTAEQEGYDRIATAHTADDNAETVLMHLLRGSGARGLAGIPPVRDNIIRPLLFASREEVERHLEARGLVHVEDSTNALDDCLRNRVRHELMPLLRALEPAAGDNLNRSARLLRADEEALDDLASRFLEAHGENGALPAETVFSLPAAVSSRVLRRMAGKSLSEAHIGSLLALCAPGQSGKSVSLPGLTVRREFDRLVFSAFETGMISPVTVRPGMEPITAGRYELRCEIVGAGADVYSSLTTFFFKCENICDNISVRSRKPGDRIRLLGRGCTKSLKKLFMEAGVPASARDAIPVLADTDGPIAIPGFGIAERCAAVPGEKAIKIECKERGKA